MTEDIFVRARQNCCRLCLAPDSECVPILTSLAADKEPLSSKIQACVNVKVSQSDRLSLRICHSCISFMNSWQSFKNRCLAAQMKQMNWLEMAKNSMRRKVANMSLQQKQLSLFQSSNKATQEKPIQNRAQNKPVTGRPMPMPIIIKEEPIDEEADAQEAAAMRLNLDPTQFLDENIVPKQEIEDKEEEPLLEPSRFLNEDPQILTSLGLTQIRKINPYSQQLAPSLDRKRQRENEEATEVPATRCRFCHMNFSSATNARRHERNIHRASEVNTIEPPKFCIKPTTPRSLLKPLHSLRSNIKPTPKVAPPPVTPEMMGIYEYNRPEKYRHLLTDSKLLFIRKNEDFLKQYQTLTCTCCPQTFPSYKTFMAHMRRKFPHLARNLCFKCLKQFQSKAIFVAHLKKRSCINLYQLYKADDSISKTGFEAFTSEKVATKEVLSNKVYECKLCSKSFRLKLDFRSHVYDAHGESIRNVAPGRCAFCSAELEDPIVKRRHYNNMECVVLLRCSICQEKFEFQQQFINHVYDMHLSVVANNNEVSGEISDATPMDASSNSHVSLTDSINSRLPHSCNICGQTYNNYYNVLRHMEGKHPDQVPKRYTCDKCDAGFPRQGPLREHMYEVHGTTLPRARRELLSCRMCSEQIDTREKWLTHQAEKHSRFTCCYCTFQSKSLDKFKDHIETHPQLSVRNVPVPVVSDTNVMSVTNGGNEGDDEDDDVKPAKRIKLDTSLYTCPMCNASFGGNVALSNHMRTHYTADTPELVDNKGIIPSVAPQITSTPNLAIHESIRRIRCHLCSKRFTSKKTYRKHMLNEHQVRNVSFIKCSVCKAEFTHERGLRVHMYKTHGTIMTNETVNAIYECEICDAEFKSEKSLNQHKGMVHKNREKEEPVEVNVQPAQNGPTFWHQCSYCALSFDSNKKLAVHLNSHEEFDANDYSCKDCGNVYNGRKSLWVHRYKKHRELRNPSTCPLCNKLFITSKALKLHMKNGHDKDDDEIEKLVNAKLEDDGNPELEKEEDSDDEQEEEHDDEHPMDEEDDAPNGLDLLAGKVHCSVCNEEFTDQDLFDKHMEMHQIDLYSDNPLAAMFDTGPDDPNEYFMNRMSENGAYTCDICPKSFPALTALKVHRNWHFRQDAKQQIPADSNMRSMVPKKKAGNVCEFCDTSFSSASNLRRHIIEVHNRENMNNPDRARKFMDKYLECTKCTMKFEEKSEWVKHKIGHANESFISAFEWGCEICGKIVSRKERLVQHMNSHLKKREQEDGNASVMSEEHSISQDTVLSSNQGRRSATGKPRTGEDDDGGDPEHEADADEKNRTQGDDAFESREDNADDPEEDDGPGEQETDDEEENEDEEEEENEDDDENDDETDDKIDEEHDAKVNNHLQYDDDSSQQYQEVDPDQDDIQDEDEEEEEGEEEEDQDNIGAYSCDLCQVYFETSKQLRRHVTSHFLNGPGSVTLTQIPKDKSYVSKVETADDTPTLTPA